MARRAWLRSLALLLPLTLGASLGACGGDGEQGSAAGAPTTSPMPPGTAAPVEDGDGEPSPSSTPSAAEDLEVPVAVGTLALRVPAGWRELPGDPEALAAAAGESSGAQAAALEALAGLAAASPYEVVVVGPDGSVVTASRRPARGASPAAYAAGLAPQGPGASVADVREVAVAGGGTAALVVLDAGDGSASVLVVAAGEDLWEVSLPGDPAVDPLAAALLDAVSVG